MHTITEDYRLVREWDEIYLAVIDYDENNTPLYSCRLSEGGLDWARKYIDEQCERLEKGKTLIFDKSESSQRAKAKYDLLNHSHVFIPTDVVPLPFILDALEGYDLETLEPNKVYELLSDHKKKLRKSQRVTKK